MNNSGLSEKQVHTLRDKGFIYDVNEPSELRLEPLAIRWLLNYYKSEQPKIERISLALLRNIAKQAQPSYFLPLYIKAVPLEIKDKEIDTYHFVFYLGDWKVELFRNINPVRKGLENEIMLDIDCFGGQIQGIFRTVEQGKTSHTIFLKFSDEELEVLRSGKPIVVD